MVFSFQQNQLARLKNRIAHFIFFLSLGIATIFPSTSFGDVLSPYSPSPLLSAPTISCDSRTEISPFAAPKPQPIRHEIERYISDAKNFYTCNNGLNCGVMMGLTAILANTSLDQDFRNWYQDDVRSKGTDDVSAFFKNFGEGKYTIPISLGGSLIYRIWEESKYGQECVAGDFLSMTARSYLVGAPTLLIGQMFIGAGRPNEHGAKSSYWNPFQDNNGISGHAFMGAMPFIVAAHQSKRWWVKAIFYTGSALTPLSRINDDAHFLSQAILGWYLAYLSVRAVAHTEKIPLCKGLTIFPIFEQGLGVGGLGIGLNYKR